MNATHGNYCYSNNSIKTLIQKYLKNQNETKKIVCFDFRLYRQNHPLPFYTNAFCFWLGSTLTLNKLKKKKKKNSFYDLRNNLVYISTNQLLLQSSLVYFNNIFNNFNSIHFDFILFYFSFLQVIQARYHSGRGHLFCCFFPSKISGGG